MKITKHDGIFYFEGDLTEAADFSSVSVSEQSRIVLDMSGIRTINSSGLNEWITWMEARQLRPVYRNCPVPVVMQLNLISELLDRGAEVESFHVPCYCYTCGKDVVFTFRSGKDFFPGQNFCIQLPECASPNCQLDPDVDLDTYGHFVREIQISS